MDFIQQIATLENFLKAKDSDTCTFPDRKQLFYLQTLLIVSKQSDERSRRAINKQFIDTDAIIKEGGKIPGIIIYEPRHEISNNVVCATSKASDQPAHTRRLIRAFASRFNIL